MFVALIKERCKQDALSIDDEALGEQFKAHVNRGVLLLYKRVKSLNDLALLMPRDICQEAQAAVEVEEVENAF